jgi:hypothetical protein
MFALANVVLPNEGQAALIVSLFVIAAAPVNAVRRL